MKHPFLMWLIVSLFIVVLMACGDQQPSQSNKVQKQEKIESQGYIKFAFYHPVVMVNNKRAQKKDAESQEYQEWIEVSFAQNSTQDITLSIIDGEGVEHEVRGQIKVLQYTRSLPDQRDLVVVRAKNPEDYLAILKAGYGELSITEYINDPEKGEIKGPAVAQLILGTKKKSDGTIELRFREGSVHSVQGKTPPVSYLFSENSRQNLTLVIEEGGIPINGMLEIFTGNYYTSLAPLWFSLDEKIKEHLRTQGGSAKVAFYVPSPDYQKAEVVTATVPSTESPEVLAKRYGTLVAMLTLKKSNK